MQSSTSSSQFWHPETVFLWLFHHLASCSSQNHFACRSTTLPSIVFHLHKCMFHFLACFHSQNCLYTSTLPSILSLPAPQAYHLSSILGWSCRHPSEGSLPLKTSHFESDLRTFLLQNNICLCRILDRFWIDLHRKIHLSFYVYHGHQVNLHSIILSMKNHQGESFFHESELCPLKSILSKKLHFSSTKEFSRFMPTAPEKKCRWD